MNKIFFDLEGHLKTGWKIILSILALFFAGIVSEIISMVITSNKVAQIIIKAILYSGIAIIISYILFKKYYKKEFKNDMDCFVLKKESILKLVFGLLVGGIAFSLVVLPLYLSGQYKLVFVGSDILPIVLNFILFISVGIVEEILTRGLMQHAFLKYGKWKALFIVSLIFSLLHIGNPGITINALLGIFLAGIFLGISMYATQSIMFAIGIHISWNWIQGSIYGIPVSGLNSSNQIFKTIIVGSNDLVTGGNFGAEASISCIIVLLLISLLLYVYGKKNNKFDIYNYIK